MIDEHLASAGASAGSVTRDRILDVAEALFADKGLSGTSMRDIASRSDLTAASLYNHFSGKDDLYAAVLQRGILPLIELMHQLAASDRQGDAASETIRAVMHHLGSRPHLPRLISHEAIAGGAHIARIARDWVRPLLEQGVFEMKRDATAMWEPEEYPLVIAAWIHLVLGHFALAPLFREVLHDDPLSPAMLERQTEMLCKLARRVMTPETDPEESPVAAH